MYYFAHDCKHFLSTSIKFYDLVVDPNSLELINELKNYVWLEKKSQTPCDNYNHLIDALRSAVAYQLANPNRGTYFVQ